MSKGCRVWLLSDFLDVVRLLKSLISHKSYCAQYAPRRWHRVSEEEEDKLRKEGVPTRAYHQHYWPEGERRYYALY